MPENDEPVQEKQKQPSPHEADRVAQRMEEADEVSVLLTEAFGPLAVTKQAAEEAGEQDASEQRREPVDAMIDMTRDVTGPPLGPRLYSAACEILEPLHLSPEMLLVYVVVLGSLSILSFPWRVILAAAGALMLLTALGLRALNVLAVAAVLLFTWEIADMTRQWERLSDILGRIF